jgi:hypothetical protein
MLFVIHYNKVNSSVDFVYYFKMKLSFCTYLKPVRTIDDENSVFILQLISKICIAIT